MRRREYVSGLEMFAFGFSCFTFGCVLMTTFFTILGHHRGWF